MRTVETAGKVETYYYLYTGHADVTALVTSDGTIAATYYYDAFGNILESTGDVNNSILYSGYQYDKETGLYYLNARMYDPKIARFLQEDTYTGQADDPLSLNLYTYCVNNPIIYIDPTGNVYVMLDEIIDKNDIDITYETIYYYFIFKSFVYNREITITVGEKTGTYAYQNIGGHIIIDSDILVEDFGFEREDVEHQIGDVFNSMDEVALAWSLKYYQLSDDSVIEYASAIYENNTGYSFSEPNIGTGIFVKPALAPEGYSKVADIHSHPDLSPSTYTFSKKKRGKLVGDYWWVDDTGLPLYLANGRGDILIAESIKKGKVKDRVVYRNIKY